jgi:hypothetical protein
MKTAQGYVVPSLASQADMLADELDDHRVRTWRSSESARPHLEAAIDVAESWRLRVSAIA